MFVEAGISPQCPDKNVFLTVIDVQEAYNVADDVERDILRKLRYLALYKRTDSDDDSDSMLGRLETISMIKKDMYSLLYAI